MFCPKCGQGNRVGDAFCIACGASLPDGEAIKQQSAPAFVPLPGYQGTPVAQMKRTRECGWFTANIVGACITLFTLPISILGAPLYGVGIYYGNRARMAGDNEAYDQSARISMIMFWTGLAVSIIVPIAAVTAWIAIIFGQFPW